MAPPHWSVSGGPSRTAIEEENFEIIIKNNDNFASNDLLKMIYIIHQFIDSVIYQDSSIMEKCTGKVSSCKTGFGLVIGFNWL